MSQKQKIVSGIAGLVICLIGVFVFVRMENQDYRDKLEILTRMLAAAQEGENQLVPAAELLRDLDGKEIKEAEALLEQYGYGEGFLNVYLKKLYFRWGVTGAAAFLFWGSYMMMLSLLDRTWQKRRRDENEKIRQALICVSRADESAAGRWDWFDQNRDESSNGIFLELNSLAENLSMTREWATAEKEETKALVTDISHQLKTPVAALRTSFDILESQELTLEEREEFGQRCKNQILRLQELVTELVNISRMENGLIAIHKTEQCIFETIVLAINRIWQMAQEKDIEVVLEADEQMQKRKIWHDEKWLSEAIINILENAVKYSKEHTMITIRMIQMNLFLRIEIQDEGIGIPKEERNQIFKRFYRGKNEIVQTSPGSGVGLYLARKILEQHQGTITVSSPIGQKYGSIFVLQIPFEKT